MNRANQKSFLVTFSFRRPFTSQEVEVFEASYSSADTNPLVSYPRRNRLRINVQRMLRHTIMLDPFFFDVIFYLKAETMF